MLNPDTDPAVRSGAAELLSEEPGDELRREGLREVIDTMKDARRRLDSDEDIALDLLRVLGPNYMKPSGTVSLEATMEADAERDAKYLGHAVAAVLRDFRRRYPKP